MLAKRINGRIRENAAVMPAVAPVQRAALSDDAPAVGAAILPRSHYLPPKSGALWKVSDSKASEALSA